jgi:polysaccharide biosynthesis transport protein
MPRLNTDPDLSAQKPYGQPYGYGAQASNTDLDSAYLRRLTQILRQRFSLILGTALLVFLAALAVVILLPSRYTATSSVIVDSRKVTVIADQQDVLGRVGTETGSIESEVEILQSSNLARKVIAKLKLDQDEEFAPKPGFMNLAMTALGVPPDPKVTQERLSQTLEEFAKILDVKRSGLTYVIDIRVTTKSPEKSALIANSLAEAYVADQLNAKIDATRRANQWLTDKAEELRKRVSDAERAVEVYKGENGLLDPGGESLPDRQVAQLSEQVGIARARVSELQAKLRRLTDAAQSGSSNAAAFPEVQQSPLIQNLRSQMGEVSRREADILARYGERHPRVINIRSELDGLRRQINAEIGRFVTASRNEYEVARARLQSLETSLNQLKDQSAQTNQASVRLKELTRDADAVRTLFQSYLARASQTNEQQSLQNPDSRIVSAALAPKNASQPRRGLILGISLLAGLGLGCGLALLAESLNRGFRAPEEVERHLGLPHFASLPHLRAFKLNPLRIKSQRLKAQVMRWLKAPFRLLGLASKEDEAATKIITHQRYAVDNPHSSYAEGIRAVRFALKHTALFRPAKIIAVVSALPDEGKSTTAANLAHYLASSGEKTLLIDADLRNPTMSFTVGERGRAGLVEVVSGQASLNDALTVDPVSNLSILGVSGQKSMVQPAEILLSDWFTSFLSNVRQNFDVIILDAAPLLPVVDGRIVMDQADAALLIVKWNETDREAVIAALRETPAANEKLLGVVLNGIDEHKQQYYDYYRSSAYLKRYPKYRRSMA